MSDTGPVSDAGIEAMRAVMDRPEQTMLAVDFDGTLAPIIDDPATRARRSGRGRGARPGWARCSAPWW